MHERAHLSVPLSVCVAMSYKEEKNFMLGRNIYAMFYFMLCLNKAAVVFKYGCR